MKKGDLLDGVKELLGKKGTLLRHGYKEKGMLNFSANTCQSLKEYVSNSAKGQTWKLKEKKWKLKYSHCMFQNILLLWGLQGWVFIG